MVPAWAGDSEITSPWEEAHPTLLLISVHLRSFAVLNPAASFGFQALGEPDLDDDLPSNTHSLCV